MLGSSLNFSFASAKVREVVDWSLLEGGIDTGASAFCIASK